MQNRYILLKIGVLLCHLEINNSWVRNCFVIDTLCGAWGKKKKHYSILWKNKIKKSNQQW
jgi:hypothetical protein